MAWSPATKRRSWTGGCAATTGSPTRGPPNSRPRWAVCVPTPPSLLAVWAWPEGRHEGTRAVLGEVVPAAAGPVPQGPPARARRGNGRRAARRRRCRAGPGAQAGGLGAALGSAHRRQRRPRRRRVADPRPDRAEPPQASALALLDGA